MLIVLNSLWVFETRVRHQPVALHELIGLLGLPFIAEAEPAGMQEATR